MRIIEGCSIIPGIDICWYRDNNKKNKILRCCLLAEIGNRNRTKKTLEK